MHSFHDYKSGNAIASSRAPISHGDPIEETGSSQAIEAALRDAATEAGRAGVSSSSSSALPPQAGRAPTPEIDDPPTADIVALSHDIRMPEYDPPTGEILALSRELRQLIEYHVPPTEPATTVWIQRTCHLVAGFLFGPVVANATSRQLGRWKHSRRG